MQWTPFSNSPNPMLAPASSTSPRRPSLETTEPESLQTPKILFRLRIIPSFFFCGIASPRMDDDPLKAAVRGNRVEEVKALLRDDPSIDINLGRGPNEWNPLQLASFKGYHKVVTVLLAHPGIDVNLKDTVGSTPLSLSCSNGKVAVVAVLLKDPRVDAILEDRSGHTPLWWASHYGACGVMEWLIASGRDLGEDRKGEIGDGKSYTALEIAKKNQHTEAVLLLKKLSTKPTLARHEARVKLGLVDELAAELFALTVFICDGLLTVKPKASSSSKAATTAIVRFFVIATALPMEQQMVLCHRIYGSNRQNILLKDSEAAFKELAIKFPASNTTAPVTTVSTQSGSSGSSLCVIC